jgi:hypothetical protein
MPRYYFDLRDNDQLAVDDEGWNFSPCKPSRLRPRARWLTWLDRRSGLRRRPIEVRDKHGPVLQARFEFELKPVGSSADGSATGRGCLQGHECPDSRSPRLAVGSGGSRPMDRAGDGGTADRAIRD